MPAQVSGFAIPLRLQRAVSHIWPERSPAFGMARKRLSIKVIEEGPQRFIEIVFDDGSIERALVDPAKKPNRRPRKPVVRARTKDYTRKKRF